jgi:phage terminase large subunit-like protein
LDWGARAASLANEWGGAEIIAEANQGGEMVREVLQLAGATAPIKLVHARFGKQARAAPIAALYAQGKVAHAGVFPALEDEMCVFGTDSAKGSPDRVDALVWAITELMLGKSMLPPRISRF